MATATLLALAAACLHAGWNLAVQQSTQDRFVVLWGQFTFGGIVSAVVVTALGGVGTEAWVWALGSGLVHIPYVVSLTEAYRLGDFSQAYPLARGVGAFGAAIGGVVLLGDSLDGTSWLAIVAVVGGLALIASTASAAGAIAAIGVGCAISVYTLLDSQGARTSDVAYYGFASGAASGLTVGLCGLVIRRPGQLARAVAIGWRPMLFGGLAQKAAYALVLAAVRLAPVGYVAALRESSAVLAVLIGWKFLGERHARRRLIGTVLATGGIALLIAGAA